MNAEMLITQAQLALARGSLDSAERAFRIALENTRDESLQAQAFFGLAGVYREQKQYQQMVQCALEALRRNELFWGPQSIQAADATALAADGFAYASEPRRAQPLYFHALEVRLLHYPPEHEQILTLQAGLLMVALEQGLVEKATELHHVLIPAYRNIAAGSDWANFLKLDQLIDRYLERNRLKEVEAILKSELTILQEHFRTHKGEINSVLKLYKAFAAKAGRTMAEWQLGVMQSDEERRDERIAEASRLNALAQASQKYDGHIDVKTARQIRDELPQFFECVASLAESGVSVNAAVVQACKLLSASCPALTRELDKAIQDFSNLNKPLSVSFVEMGKRFNVDELCQLGLTMIVAEKTGCSVAALFREQSFALRYHLKAKKIELTSLGNRSVSADTSSLKRMASDEERRKRKLKQDGG
jgi:tetratricopeptide (TPR) repeat protein